MIRASVPAMNASERATAAARVVPGPALALRPYQRAAIDAISANPHKRQIIALPTGCGKTIVFVHAIRDVAAKGERAIVLVHRDELVGQTLEKLAVVAPGLPVGVVKAERDDHGAPVVVASVQTLARPQRLHGLARDFSLVIVDEAHHAMAPSWRAVLTYLGCFEPAGPLTVGFTATPERGDGADLAEVFEAITYHRDLLSMIREGYLCDLRGMQIHLDVDLDRVHSRGGDFIEAELAAEMERADTPRHIVRAYREYAAGRKGLAFLPSVALAEETARLFRAAGIAAGMVSGTTPLDERRHTLAELRAGRLRIVANCGVLTEGFDDPSVDCILLARPTQSRPLYIQIVGRATRLHPGKQDALILDFAGASSRHELVTLGRLFGLAPADLESQSVLEAIAAEEEERERRRVAARDRERERIEDIIGRSVDLFHRKPLHWAQQGDVYALSIPGGSLALQPAGDGYVVVRLEGGRGVERLAPPLPLHFAQGVAEDWARSHQAHGLATPDAPWRSQPASAKQIALLHKLGVAVPPGLTRGGASDLIATTFASKTLGRRRRTA
jgi:superfamily II DNA or RNA helicase